MSKSNIKSFITVDEIDLNIGMEYLSIVIRPIRDEIEPSFVEKATERLRRSFGQETPVRSYGWAHLAIGTVAIIVIITVIFPAKVTLLERFFGQPTSGLVSYDISESGRVLGVSTDEADAIPSIQGRLLKLCQESTVMRGICW